MKIDEPGLKKLLKEQKTESAKLRVIDAGMNVVLVVRIKDDPGEAVLHTKRGGQRKMSAQKALRYVQETFDPKEITVELRKDGRRKDDAV